MSLVAAELDFAYPRGTPVLRAVSVSFPPGALTAIVGPNGAGKSTLLRILAGLLTPSRGRVTLDAHAVASHPAPDRARRIVYIPQASRVGFAFPARAVVRMGLYAAGASPADTTALDALARVDLADRADTPFANLSAGQQQRVTLARALAQLDLPAPPDDPHPTTRAVLADEPVSAMDPLHARRSLDTLSSVAASGAVVAVVLHDLAAVLRHANRVVLLDAQGQIAAAGPTHDILRPPLLERVFGVPFQEFSNPSGPVAIVPV